MKNIGIWVNAEKEMSFKLTTDIISIADKLGARCEIADENKTYDFIISLGGDGTFLAAARKFIEFETPIVGVNLGCLGYLSEICKDKLEEGIGKILRNEYRIEERILLEAEIQGKKLYALNDVVVDRGHFTKMIRLDVSLDNQFIDKYAADGIIISTPTGSTAYSMSAGGPIVEPNLDVLLITPICAHSLRQRPLIVDGNHTVNIKVESEEFMVIADGQESVEGSFVKEFSVKESDKKVKVIRLTDNSFFEKVREKLI